MFEIKVTVEIPDLVKAAEMLAGYNGKGYLESLEALKTQIPEAVPPYTAPDMPLPVAAPTAAPAFTVEQVAKAGANLLTSKPDLMGPLQELLSRYGVGSVKELPTDKLGEFAAELRKMGAKI
jgi:hypothetical protein